jgi:hypothetical protein
MGRRDDRLAKDREILTALIADGGLKEWVQATWRHRSVRREASFYNRLAELPEDVRRRYERLPDGRMVDTDILDALRDFTAIVVNRSKKAGRRATLEELRKLWAKSQYRDLPIESYWKHLPASERREVEE